MNDASAAKGRTRYERALDWAMSLFASFSPLVLLGVVLMLLLDGFVGLLHLFGVGKRMPGLIGDEPLVIILVGIVISLLLIILRALERIASRIEDILSKFDDLVR
jgi:hypothetical protein